MAMAAGIVLVDVLYNFILGYVAACATLRSNMSPKLTLLIESMVITEDAGLPAPLK